MDQRFSHPDPAGNQLRALQTQIRTLMKGKTAVRSDSALDGTYGYSMVTPGKEWKNKLPNMYFWVDYCSIPQPAAAGGVHAAQHSDHREGQGGPRRAAQGGGKQHPLVSRAIDDDVGARAAGQP